MRPQIIHKPEELATLLDANAPRTQADLCRVSSAMFNPREWINGHGNIALKQGMDLAMFEYMGPGAYLGHIWFGSRGRHALEVARDMLETMFDKYDARLIRGEIPLWRKDVAWFMRLLGFEQERLEIRPQGAVMVARLTREHLPDAS